jgi:hypothetical protein
MSATDAVLNSGTVFSEVQVANMLFMVVTEAVLNSGTLFREEQP